MKNLFRLLFCIFLTACGSEEDSANENAINLHASISANVSSLSFENTMVTQVSDSQVIIISAENTTSEINISTPAGYEISTDNNLFFEDISFVPEISNEIFIRFAPNEAINYNSFLVISSNEINNNISS